MQRTTSELTARRVSRPLASHGGRGCGYLSWPSCRFAGVAVVVVVVVRRHGVTPSPSPLPALRRRHRQRSHVAGVFIGIVVVAVLTRPLASRSCHGHHRRRRRGSSPRSLPLSSLSVVGGGRRVRQCYPLYLLLPDVAQVGVLRATVMIQWLASWRRWRSFTISVSHRCPMARSSANNVMVAGSVAGVSAGGASAFSDGGGSVCRPRAVCGNARMASSVARRLTRPSAC